ncbi:MAG TPA: hypothetical protein VK911_16700, partial [Vicinamibacterales bacterium]|nr:hypothetical protein [Vicinamibacterales bacterium]
YAPATEREYEARLAFSMKFQQYTAPVQAKGVEDTAFYRYNLLVALNEVGGEPSRFGRTAGEVHARNAARRQQAPHEMLTTATHDTKLGEDVRARIAVISELPGEWRRHLSRWARINAGQHRKVRGRSAPDRNDEYRFYQVLLGAWPAPPPGGDPEPPSPRLVERLRDYMMKAIKEAKVHTSWVNDNEAYDAAMARFVENVLTGPSARRFLASFLPFQARVARLAVANSLAQVVLKIASPGAPDFYQGTELWDLHLVDPDNRQPVDFARRRELLAQLAPLVPAIAGMAEQRAGGRDPAEGTPDRGEDRAALLARMLDGWGDGRVKLWVTTAGLRARRARRELFLNGEYQPLEAATNRGAELFAFARLRGDEAAVAVVPRFVSRLGDGWRDWAANWGDAGVVLPDGLAGRRWVNALTGERLEAEAGDRGAFLPAATLLRHCPVALLIT